jgi:hypothetical protein
MANRDSQTTTPKDNPQRFDQPPNLARATASLPDHLDAFGDTLKAFRWGLAIRQITGPSVDEPVFEVRTMVEALQGELNKLFDPVRFGDIGKVLDMPHVYNKTYHLQGLIYLMDGALCSMNLAGDAGYPSEALDSKGVERLFGLICGAFDGLRRMIAEEMQSHTIGATCAH